jgi:HK97 family phage major capsid protein
MELTQQLTELISEQKTFVTKAKEEFASLGSVTQATKECLDKLQKQVDALDVKLADRHVGESQEESLEEMLRKDEGVTRLLKSRSGHAAVTISGKHARNLIERKTTITSALVGQAVSGVLQIDRVAGITVEARQALRIRDLLTARPTLMQVVDFVRVKQALSPASPVAEASSKFENALNFESKSEKVRTIATWIPATKQILDDFSELAGFINTSLPYYVNLEEELQLLSGDSTGENLDGLIVQASAFNTALLHAAAGWNKIDIVGRTIEQITAAKELQPTFIVLHPTDWWDIRLTKDQFGRYILGDPQTNVAPSLFGLDVVSTTSIASGTFLVGSGSPIASEIRDRMEMQVEISTEHADFFTKNLVAIRAEKRLALIVKRPASYITGTFTTSP